MEGCTLCALVLTLYSMLGQCVPNRSKDEDKLEPDLSLNLGWGSLRHFHYVDVHPRYQVGRSIWGNNYIPLRIALHLLGPIFFIETENLVELMPLLDRGDKIMDNSFLLNTDPPSCKSLSLAWLNTCLSTDSECRQERSKLLQTGFQRDSLTLAL